MAKKKKPKKNKPKATTKTEEEDTQIAVDKETDRKKAHIDGIIKTLFPAVLGVVFGFLCYSSLGTGAPEEGASGMIYPWYLVMTIVIGVTILVQKYVYPFMKIDVQNFEGKDWIYVEFIAVDLWLVTWTILLN